MTDPYKRDLTHLFWEEVIPLFDVYISGFVIDEIEATNNLSLRKKLWHLIRDFKLLEIDEDVIKVADIYLSYRKLPRLDARHLAIASLGNMNFLVTWNLKHLYKRGTQEMVQKVNTTLKIPVPIIVTPKDFLKKEVSEMPKKEVSELEKEQIRRRVMKEFPLSKCLREIHYYRYVKEIEEQTMSPEEIIKDINEKVRRFKEEMKK